MPAPAATQAIRSFIPCKDWAISRKFYTELGAEELWTNEENLALYSWGDNRFYLQNYYVKDWAENTMFYLTVDDVQEWWEHLKSLDLRTRYGVRMRAPFRTDYGAEEIHLHDPAGVLWFFGKFDE